VQMFVSHVVNLLKGSSETVRRKKVYLSGDSKLQSDLGQRWLLCKMFPIFLYIFITKYQVLSFHTIKYVGKKVLSLLYLK